ncbi:ATP-binding protein [Streptomyces sp. NPDC051018]|uniref:ATP-binding protein n=1 Tax=Streptomyces sp. NPDC051018 TaxID=3365639 RepID=UPI0037AF0B03
MHEYMSQVRVWGLTCPGFREEVSRARRWACDILSGHPSADDIALIVSELGTNALRYTASGRANGLFHVSLALSAHVVAVSVTDGGDSETIPEATAADDLALNGRGLDIITALAHGFAVHDTGQGHTVTAEFHTDRPGGHPW